MAKKVIDRGAPSTSSPKSSKSKKDPKLKTSASSEKIQFKNKKCAQCSKHPKPNFNYNARNISHQSYDFLGTFQAQAAATIARRNNYLHERGLNLLEPLIPMSPLQLGYYAWTNMPPQCTSYVPNFCSQLSSAPGLCNFQAKNNPTAPYYSNYMVKKKDMMRAPGQQALELFPDGVRVNNSTCGFKGLEKEKVNYSGASTVAASNAEVDLELRL